MDFSQQYFHDLKDVSSRIETATLDETIEFQAGVESFAEMATLAAENGNKLYFIGNGGSSGIVSHMAADFTKNGRIPALTFTDNSLLTCLSNDLGYENVYSEPLKIMGQPGDVLIAVSSSGQSENIVRASKTALDLGMKVISLSGFKADNPLRQLGNVRFYVPSSSYGYVEILHMTVIHCALDYLMANKSP